MIVLLKGSFAFLLLLLLLLLSISASLVNAQFNFFEQMFGGSGGNGHHHQPQDVPSDSAWYRKQWQDVRCSKYLCSGTLACVDVPHHCPCAYPDVEDKVELGDGIAVCASKGGREEGETLKKIDLARKGLL